MSYLGKEFTSIAGLNENITLETAEVLFSPNLKFGVIYSPSVILCLDLNTKELTSKLHFSSEDRISKVKITQNNTLMYIKENKANLIEIVSLNFNNHNEYAELKLEPRVFEYDSWLKGGINYFFIITINCDLMLYKDNLIVIKQNIGRDILCGNDIQYNPIAKMEYIENSNMLLVITIQGQCLLYHVNEDDTNMNYNPHFDLVDSDQIASAIKANVHISIMSIKQSSFICYNHKHNCSGGKGNKDQMDIIEEESSNDDHNHQQRNVFLTVISKLNKKDTIMSFYSIENQRLSKRNELLYKNNICIDAFISEYPSNNIKDEDVYNDTETNIPIYLFVCFKTLKAFEFYYTDLLDCFGKKIRTENDNDSLELTYFHTLSGDVSNIRNIAFINIFITQNKLCFNSKYNNEDNNKNIGVLNHLCNVIKLNIMIFRRVNEYECYITNEIISNQLTFLSNDEGDNDNDVDNEINAVFKEAFSTDVNQYLTFFFKERNSLENISLYKDKVIHVISQENILVNTFNSSFDIRNCNIDPYLMLLIYNNSLLSIKKYLNTKDNYNYNQFLVSNDVLFDTVKLIYTNIRNGIKRTISKEVNVKESMGSSISTSTSELHPKLIPYMKLLIEVMKLIRHRNTHPIGQPYIIENDIMTNEAIVIDSYIFDMEVVLMMTKIHNECIINGINTSISLEKIAHRDYCYVKIINLEDNLAELSGLSDLFAHYFQKCSIESLIEDFQKEKKLSSTIQGLIYYLKFMFFNYYYYLVNTIPSLKEEGKDIDETNPYSLYNGITKEYNEYNRYSANFFLLDQKNKSINNNSINSKIDNQPFDQFVITQFFLKLNQLDIIHNQAFNEIFSNTQAKTLNAMLIKAMIQQGYISSSYSISNTLITYYKEYDEWINHVYLLLRLSMFNVAYQTISQFFSNDYLTLQMSQVTSSNLTTNNKIESLITSDKYPVMKAMHWYLYNYLIENEYIDILFTLPLTFIERHMLKEFLLGKKKYEELLIVYYAQYHNCKESNQCFNDYLKKSSFGKESSKELYKHMIDSLFYLFGSEEEKKQIKESTISNIRVDNKSLFIDCNVSKEKQSIGYESYGNENALGFNLKSNICMNQSGVSKSNDLSAIRSSNNSNQSNDFIKGSINRIKNMSEVQKSEIVFGEKYMGSIPVKVLPTFNFIQK